VRDCHELGECCPPEERVVCHFKISYLELHVLGAEIFLSLEGHKNSDLTDRGRCCPKDYSVKGSSTGTQCYSRQPHLVKGLQEQDVQGATSIDEDSIELDILHNGAGNERVPTWLWDKVRVVAVVEGDGDLGPLQVCRGGG
jgi:hypothetical protein